MRDTLTTGKGLLRRKGQPGVHSADSARDARSNEKYHPLAGPIDVMAITGDCGAMLHYQREVAKMTKTPVLLSALLQAPLLATVFQQGVRRVAARIAASWGWR